MYTRVEGMSSVNHLNNRRAEVRLKTWNQRRSVRSEAPSRLYRVLTSPALCFSISAHEQS